MDESLIGSFMGNQRIRVWVDRSVVLAHTLALAITLGIDPAFATDSTPGLLLVTVEGVAICFHIGYLLLYYWNPAFCSARNQWKWVEYGITATMATVAVLYTTDNNSSGPSLVIMLAAAGISQQTQGYALEFTNGALVAYLVAVLLQACEFVAVFLSVDSEDNNNVANKNFVVIIYIITYCLFGVHAAVVKWLPDFVVSRPEVSEVMYSTLGCLSKISIYIAEFAYLREAKHWLAAIFGVVIFLSVATLIPVVIDPAGKRLFGDVGTG